MVRNSFTSVIAYVQDKTSKQKLFLFQLSVITKPFIYTLVKHPVGGSTCAQFYKGKRECDSFRESKAYKVLHKPVIEIWSLLRQLFWKCTHVVWFMEGRISQIDFLSKFIARFSGKAAPELIRSWKICRCYIACWRWFLKEWLYACRQSISRGSELCREGARERLRRILGG